MPNSVPTRDDPVLQESDVRTIVRLLGDVAGYDGPLDTKRVLLMEGLCGLVEADFWTWSLMGEPTAKIPLSHTVFLHGGFKDGQLASYLKVQEHPDLQRMTASFLQALMTSGDHVTRSADQMISRKEIEQLDIFPYLQAADSDGIIVSGCHTSEGQVSIISLFRSFDRPWFDARETRIAHIVLSEVAWLYDKSWPQHPRQDIASLTPRLRTILGLLLEGMDRQQIAHELDIAVNTVHGYIKEIYQLFEVHSQPQLMSRFTRGDGGDVAAAPSN